MSYEWGSCHVSGDHVRRDGTLTLVLNGRIPPGVQKEDTAGLGQVERHATRLFHEKTSRRRNRLLAYLQTHEEDRDLRNGHEGLDHGITLLRGHATVQFYTMEAGFSQTPVNQVQEGYKLTEDDTLDGAIHSTEFRQLFHQRFHLGTTRPRDPGGRATRLKHAIHNGRGAGFLGNILKRGRRECILIQVDG